MDLDYFNTFDKPQILTLWIYITEKCNLKCKHCYLKKRRLKKELTTENLYKILDDYIYFLRLFKIRGFLRITGGEPLLRKDLFKFLKAVSQYNKNREIANLGVLTNGTLVTERIAKNLKSLGVDGIGLSLEGIEKNTDFIRGKGVFKKIISAVKLLVKTKIPVSIEFTANKLNYKDLPLIAKLGEENGVNAIRASYFVPTGNGKKIKNLALNYSELKEYYLQAKSLSMEKRGRLNISPTETLAFLATTRKKDKFICETKPAKNMVTILPNGNVISCYSLPIKKTAGNICQQSFTDIYLNSPVFKKLRKLPPTKFPQCNFIQAYRA